MKLNEAIKSVDTMLTADGRARPPRLTVGERHALEAVLEAALLWDEWEQCEYGSDTLAAGWIGAVVIYEGRWWDVIGVRGSVLELDDHYGSGERTIARADHVMLAGQ